MFPLFYKICILANKKREEILRVAAIKMVQSKDEDVKDMIETAVRVFYLFEKFKVNHYVNSALLDLKIQVIEQGQTIGKNKQW